MDVNPRTARRFGYGERANGDSLTASGYAGSHLEYLGTARVRLGYAFGNLLPYITGGFAYGQTSSYYNSIYNQ